MGSEESKVCLNSVNGRAIDGTEHLGCAPHWSSGQTVRLSRVRDTHEPETGRVGCGGCLHTSVGGRLPDRLGMPLRITFLCVLIGPATHPPWYDRLFCDLRLPDSQVS